MLVVHLNKGAPIISGRLCDPDWIQTNDLLLRRQLLYSTELPGRFKNRAQRYQIDGKGLVA